MSPLDRLIQELARLPGIGEKTAARLAFFILRSPRENALRFAEAIQEVVSQIHFCSSCQNFTHQDPCSLCISPSRDTHTILVVEGPQEMRALEQGRNYKGLYHVLHGALSPLDRIGPDDLKIKELLQRVQRESPQEVILATNTNVEGEATALYLTKLIKPLGVKVSRIAMGIPMGSDLEYMDALTLKRALESRQLL